MKKGTLFLIPNTLGSDTIDHVMPPAHASTIAEIRHFIVESEKSAKSLLKKLRYPHRFEEIDFYLLNEHTSAAEHAGFMKPLQEGNNAGLVSDAGCPGVADPGAEIVRLAHRKGITVKPLTGPSSILLALMSSGMNGQTFTFHGYLPYEKPVRLKKIQEMERTAKAGNHTHLFIEAPYRNKALFTELVQSCKGETLLGIACDLTLDSELVATKSISEWRTSAQPEINKKPCIFLIGS